MDDRVTTEQATIFLHGPRGMSFLTALKKQEYVIEMTDTSALNRFLQNAKYSMKLLGEAMKSVYYVYEAKLCHLEELHEIGVSKI